MAKGKDATKWTAKYTVQKADSAWTGRNISYTVMFADGSGNFGVNCTATLDKTTVEIDTVVPTLTASGFSTNNKVDSKRATVRDAPSTREGKAIDRRDCREQIPKV